MQPVGQSMSSTSNRTKRAGLRISTVVVVSAIGLLGFALSKRDASGEPKASASI